MLVDIGTVLKPRGLKGELKVGITFNRPQVFNNLQTVYFHKQPYQVIKSSVQNGFGYITLAGITSIEQAEPFRNQTLAVAADTLNLQADEVLSSQLLGFNVVHLGRQIGKVTAVENYGGGDCFEIAVTGKGLILIPNEDDFILETNMTTKTLTLTARALDEELV